MADHEHRPQRTDGGTSWRQWALGVVIVILLLFMALNSQQVEVDLIIGTAKMPLIFALLIAAALGALVGWATPRIRAHGRKD